MVRLVVREKGGRNKQSDREREKKQSDSEKRGRKEQSDGEKQNGNVIKLVCVFFAQR